MGRAGSPGRTRAPFPSGERGASRGAARPDQAQRGDGGTRTPNPRLAKAVLCQLSYVPEIHVGGPILGPDLELALAVRSAQVRRRGGLRPQVLLFAPLTPAANERSSRGDQRGNSEQLSRHKALLTSRRSRRTPAVGLGGLEPPASSLSGMRSNRLSYRPGT